MPSTQDILAALTPDKEVSKHMPMPGETPQPEDPKTLQDWMYNRMGPTYHYPPASQVELNRMYEYQTDPMHSIGGRILASRAPKHENIMNWHWNTPRTGSDFKDWLLGSLGPASAVMRMGGMAKGLGTAGEVLNPGQNIGMEAGVGQAKYPGLKPFVADDPQSSGALDFDLPANDRPGMPRYEGQTDWANPANWPDSAKYQLALRNQQAQKGAPGDMAAQNEAIKGLLSAQDQLRGNPIYPATADELLGMHKQSIQSPNEFLGPGKFMTQQMWNKIRDVSNTNEINEPPNGQ